MANDVLGAVKKPKKIEIPDPKVTVIDTSNILNYLGTRAKPSQIGFSVLRHMALRAKPISAIIQTRLNQVSTFARQPSFKDDTGFRITLKDMDRELTPAERKKAREIEEAFLRTGFVPNKVRKDNFNMFLRKIVRDSLILDTLAFELVFNRKGEVCEWWAVDGATVEMVLDQVPNAGDVPVYQPITSRGIMDEGNIAYVQRINSIIVAEWTEDELAYAIRNPRTDIAYNLFGLSELEMLVETVTSILNAESYNSAYFTHNNLPQGVLEIVGKYEDEHLEAFKRAWESLINGSVGKWKVPIMALEEGQGLKFTPFKQNSRDMEFHQWLEFLTSIACAVYQIDPAEIGLKAWSGGRQGLFNSDSEATRIEASKDKGFFPLMQFLSETFNSELIDRIDPNFKFEWVGLNEEDVDQKEQRRTARINSGFTTVNEERLAEDMTTIEQMLIEQGVDEDMAKQLGAWANAPANAVLMQVYQMSAQQAMQAEQAGIEHARGMEQQLLAQGQQTDQFELQQQAEASIYARGYEQSMFSQQQQAEQQNASESLSHARGLEQHMLSRQQQQEQHDRQQQGAREASVRNLEQRSIEDSENKVNNKVPNNPNIDIDNNNNNNKKRLNKSISMTEDLVFEFELDV